MGPSPFNAVAPHMAAMRVLGDKDTLEDRIERWLDRRAYIARYAPGYSQQYLDGLTGDRVHEIFMSVHRLIVRESTPAKREGGEAPPQRPRGRARSRLR